MLNDRLLKNPAKLNISFDSSPQQHYYSRPMQKVNLPASLDPSRAAQKQSSYDGSIPHGKLPLLAEMATDNGEVEVKLAFDRDDQGLVVLSCQIHTGLQLVCQRCGESFIYNVDRTVAYSPINDDTAADELPDSYEPVLVSESGELDVFQLIAEEILLAAPIVAMHDNDACHLGSEDMSCGKIDDAENAKPNPFSVLSKLKSSEE